MKYLNKYRVNSTRLKYWDYSNPGMYFVTICTKNFRCWFGDIVEGEMMLNELGNIADYEWKKTGELRNNIILDEFVIMPNHIHGIICITDVETRRAVSLPENKNKFGPLKKGSLSTIIGSYKSAVTRSIRKHYNSNFKWQPRFYDHIIRDETALENIQHYIRQNPENWDKDKNLIQEDQRFISKLN